MGMQRSGARLLDSGGLVNMTQITLNGRAIR
jgi:hypothetical protein